ncbi:MAG: EAL domain-containing protein [Leptolyngbyaceae cyanobacterium MAG.088]|nr:EAL domain-containing protein [Leptolyngbyaceae cyanobacterium MAG.088]
MDSQKQERIGNILIVDDQPHNLGVLSDLLTLNHYKVRCAISGAMALKAIKVDPPDLVLLDIFMPEMDGYEVCRLLKQDAKHQNIPVIFLSALGEADDKVKAFDVGGVDYVTKPFQPTEVLARIRNQLALRFCQAEIVQLNASLELKVEQRTAELRAEVEKRQIAQERLLYLATHDPLTKLPNRASLMQKIYDLLARNQTESGHRFGLLFLDLDRFKVINDSLGHIIGDQLLFSVAQRLQQVIPQHSFVARLGGDEFTLLIEDFEYEQDLIIIFETIRDAIKEVFLIDDMELFIDVSAGICYQSRNYEKPEHLLRDADTAMYHAKSEKSGYKVFNASMHLEAVAEFSLQTELAKTVKTLSLKKPQPGPILPYYQPIISLKTGEITGFETLARWHHPSQGWISPGNFIPIAEKTGLIFPISLFIFKLACHQLITWKQQGLITPLARISVNLSAKHFMQDDLIEQIDRLLLDTGLPGGALKLEITEGSLIRNEAEAIEILEALRDREIELAIDDFGTGYSSLSYLYRFPVKTLKLDQSFICDLDKPNTGQRAEIVKTVIHLAHTLGMEVVAEGIETAQQTKILQDIGCDLGQGYWFARPSGAAEIEKFLQTQTTIAPLNEQQYPVD